MTKLEKEINKSEKLLRKWKKEYDSIENLIFDKIWEGYFPEQKKLNKKGGN